MFKIKIRGLISLMMLTSMVSEAVLASDVYIAVASNFRTTLQALVAAYAEQSDDRVTLSSGSTGKHYAQIINGAPFDLFFAADDISPKRLEQQGLVRNSSRYTYALGKLVLWSPMAEYVDANGVVLSNGLFRYLALANPKLAPYGQAGYDVLENLGLVERLAGRVVLGENINQTMQFVSSANAELGFVAYSQIIGLSRLEQGSMWHVPQELYTPIKQQAVQLTDNVAGSDFLRFVRSERGARIIVESGYQLASGASEVQ